MELSALSVSLMYSSIAQSTMKQYQACLLKYVNWCQQMNMVAFPLYQQNLILFVTELSLTLSHGYIKSHLAAVNFFSHTNGYTTSFVPFKRLYLLLRGIKKYQGKKFKKEKRIPVTPEMLFSIKFNLFNSSLIYNNKLMIWAAMLTAFFGFLRVSEYTSPNVHSFLPESTLCYNDITLQNTQISLTLKASKTDPFRSGTTVRLAANGSPLCPVAALSAFMMNHPSQSGPLFVFHDGKYLTREKISKYLKQFISSMPVKNVSSHSFRIGAATTAARAGYPRWLIQTLGRWSSDCFREYIRISDETIAMVSSSMLEIPTNNMDSYDPDLMV